MKKSVALCFLLAYVGLAFGQSDFGNPSFETLYPVNAYESVNLGNLNIVLAVPVRAKNGPVPIGFTLTENVQIYRSTPFVNVQLDSTTASDFKVASGYWTGDAIFTTSTPSPCGPTIPQYQFTALVDGNGTRHPLPPGTVWTICSGPVDVYATDASGLELSIPTNAFGGLSSTIVYTRDGVKSFFDPTSPFHGQTENSHGYGFDISAGVVTDALSATPVLTLGTHTYGYTDGNGTARNVSYTLTTGTFLPDYTGCFTNQSTTFNSPDTVTFPDSSTLKFTWEKTVAGNYDGRLATVVVPTGGTFTHAYSGGTSGQGLWCDFTTGISAATMTISNGTGTWTFARTIGGGTYPNRTITTTVTKPDGSKTVYTFVGDNTPILTSKVVKDTDGTTVLDTMTYCYDSTISSCNPTPPTQHPAVVRAYRTVPGVAAGKSEVDTHYDANGQITEVDNFDFGPTLVGKTFTVYGSWNGSSCVSMAATAHILDRPCQVYSTNAAGTTIAQSYFNYDTTYGDLLNQYDYTAAGVYLTTSHTYNANGTLASTTAVDGILTTYGNTQCNNLLPDHATTGVGTASMTWDCNLAMVKTTTDLNGLVTTNTYGDSMLRVTQVSDNGGQAPVVYTYTSATQMRKNMTFNSNGSITDASTKMDSLGRILSAQRRRSVSGNYETVSYTYDTSGRVNGVSVPCLIATLGGTCPTLASSYTYDGMGRIKTNTILTGTNGVYTYTYSNGDVKMVLTPAPAGEVAKTVQIEYDGLGRPVSNCAVTSTLSGNGSCGQRTAANGYLTKNTLDALGRITQISRNAQAGATPLNTTAAYDFLSRPTTATSPESGTMTYQYDVPTALCPDQGISKAGHLNSTLDARGNTLCYWYEGTGQRLSVVFPTSGSPDYSITNPPSWCYELDCGDPPFGTNTIGRIAMAVTCPNPGPCSLSNPSIERFGYDKYGRLTDVWERSSSLALNTYFHITATYWDNGQIKTLGGIPGVSDFTFGIDAAGRPNSASSGATSIVSSVVYDSAGNPITVNFANGDQDTYTWDGASQNMTQYRFKIGTAGTTDTGTLTWNPNLTLQKLVIVDNVNGGDSQTCNYTHDDIARIATSNCGALWNETYAYTSMGNVTKSGSLSFAPGYTASNNRMLAPYTYDANGRLLHDATLNQDYGYDALDLLVSSAGNVIINDAFGSMIDKNVSGTHTYYLNSPVGMLGSASSLTAKLNLRIPLPGGGTITYDSAGNEQINHPDFQGSTRLVTNRAARTYAAQFCYGPMGEIYCGTASASQYQGSFQDTSTGLDDFDATRYSGAQGRSITPTGGANGYVKTNRPF